MHCVSFWQYNEAVCGLWFWHPPWSYSLNASFCCCYINVVVFCVGFLTCVGFLSVSTVETVFSSFAIILKRKRELVTLLLLSYGCLVTVNVLWIFLTVPWVGLQCVTVVFLIIHTSLFSRGFIMQFFVFVPVWSSSRWERVYFLHCLLCTCLCIIRINHEYEGWI